MDAELERILAVAREAGAEAARVTLAHYGRAGLVERKADRSPVTAADRAAEAAVRACIAAAFPGHTIVGEEEGTSGAPGEVRWFVDPIDATRNFVRGVPFFATLIGVEVRGTLCVGVVEAPALGERWHAARGGGAFRNGERVRVSRCGAWADAGVLFGGVDLFDRAQEREAFWRLAGGCEYPRGFGDWHGHLLVAAGAFDVMLDPRVKPWDVAAPCVVVEEAGGRMTGLDGGPPLHAGGVLSSNGALHAEALARWRGAGPADAR